MSASWNSDFIDLVSCLNDERAEYLVVGAFACLNPYAPRAVRPVPVDDLPHQLP